jgi:hypothetical protein
VTIAAPYKIEKLAPAAQAILEQQFAASLGSTSGVTFGIRQVTGGKKQGFLMVMAFPGTVAPDVAYSMMVAGMKSSMNATLTETTFEGVKVSSGKASAGGLAIFSAGTGHIVMVISEDATEALPMSKALISAN